MKNDHQWVILDFISAKFVLGYPCVSSHILYYMHGPAILLCKYHKITQIQKCSYTTVLKSFAPKR